MKIVDVAVKKVYRFADSQDLEDIGGKVIKFFCPVCQKERYIAWSDLRKKIVYEGEASQKSQLLS